MTDKEQQFKQYIDNIVFQWTTKYFSSTYFQSSEGNTYKYLTEFSLPTKLQPVPLTKVKVYFTLVDEEKKDPTVTFRFENQSLVHKASHTIRSTQMEKWIDRLLKEKESTKDVLFMGTEFEAGRTKDPRMLDIMKEAKIKAVDRELKKLNESLLTLSYDTASEASIGERPLDGLRRTLYDLFRAVDKEDMGVISYKECDEILRSMQIELSELELNNLLIIADKNRNGMIEYKEFINIGGEILYGLLLKQQSEMKFKEDEELYTNQAILVLYNDELHEISRTLLEECKKLDEEDKNDYITFSQLEELLRSHQNLLTDREIELLMKKIENRYPDNFPYADLPDLLFSFKVDIIKAGFMESHPSKLELYLLKLFEAHDQEKKGKLPLDTIAEALSRADKLILSKMQLIILKNFLKVDSEGHVEYGKQCKFLAEMIRHMFDPAAIKKQDQFIQKGAVAGDKYMEGWTTETIKHAIDEIFVKYDTDKNMKLDKTEYVEMLKGSQLKMTDEEIYALMEAADKNRDGFISLKEFRNHFYDILKLMRKQMAFMRLANVTQI